MNPLSDWHGRLPSDWPLVPLRNVAELGTGHTPDRTRPEYWVDCSIPWVTAADLSSRPSEFDPLMETTQHISELGVANSAAVVHPPGTIMFCRTASVGLLTVIGRPMATTQAFVTWSPGPRLLSRYLLYVLAAMRPELFRIAYGSTHLTIYMPDLEALRIPLPPRDAQQRIANFLDDQIDRLDRAVSLRERQSSGLLARRDAEVRSLLTGQARPDLAETGSRWFPRLPTSWLAMQLKHRWKVIDCKHRTPTYRDEGYPLVSTGDIAPGRLDLAKTSRFVDHADFLDLADCLRRPVRGDIVYSRNASLGTASYVDTESPFTMGQDVCRITSAGDQLYLCHVLNFLVSDQVEEQSVGSTFKRINIDRIRRLEVPVPPIDEQANVARSVEGVLAETASAVDSMSRSSALFVERRQALIAAAVTGQFDVTTARAVA